MKILKVCIAILFTTALFTSCQKEYSLEGVNVKVPVGSWQFKDSLRQFTGVIDTAYIDSSANTKKLHLIGTSSLGTENFTLELFSSENFKAGTYRASLSEAELNYFTSTKTIYEADQLTGEFIVNITSFGDNKIAGTFSGLALDSSGNLKEITVGKFSAALVTSANTVAIGTLGSTAGNCTPVTPNGTYTQGITLTPANTVQLQVNVTTPGTYTISTNSVNGVMFSGSGTFNTTGVQNVILIGAGTPLDSSDQNYTVTFNASVCNFTIHFLSGTTPQTGDYFPITLNSTWTYGLIGGSSTDSTLTTAVDYSPVFAGNTYSTITSNDFPYQDINDDSSYYRKSGGDYYQYSDIGTALGLDDPLFAEYIFLKDNVAINTVWQSPNFSGTFAGVPVSGYFRATILEKNVPATVGSLNFQDVIKVKYDYYYSISSTPFATETKWFAKGVGLVYDELPTGETSRLGSYQVF